MSAIAVLRSRTRQNHERVDAAFSAFDLNDERSYRAFLTAHSRALPIFEAILELEKALPVVRMRTPLLAADMATLGEPMPLPLQFEGPVEGAATWGLLYVVEGSRLGGSILAKQVKGGLPNAYLSAQHNPGEWRALGQALDREAAQHDSGWIASAVHAAGACFDLYRDAAEVGRQ